MGRPFKVPHPPRQAPTSTGGGAARPSAKGWSKMVVGYDGGFFGKVTVKTPARGGAQTLGACRGRGPIEAI